MEMKYNVGDRVRISAGEVNYNTPRSASKWLGQVMTIARVRHYGDRLFYIMKEDFGEHAWFPCSIEGLAESEKRLMITHSGKTMTVNEFFNGNLVKSIKVDCSTDEDFNLIEKAKAVLDQIAARDNERYNGKVVCVHDETPAFTKGKIYEVKGGLLIDDNEEKYEGIRSFKDIETRLTSTFIELVD